MPSIVNGQLEAESERREDDAARAIVAARAPDAIFEPGSANRVAEIDREFERLVAERAKAGALAADARRRKASALRIDLRPSQDGVERRLRSEATCHPELVEG